MKKIYLVLLLTASFVFNAKSQVVINEVYGGGNNVGAAFRNDFIELYNNSSSNINISGYKLEYFSAAGNSGGSIVFTSGTVINANSYFLVQLAGGTTNGAALPTPDATQNSINMSATTGRVDFTNGAILVDRVGFGTANLFEGTGPAPTPANPTSVQRKTVGLDNNDNSTDFEVKAPTPTNSGSIIDATPPTVTSLSPADNATNVVSSSTATIIFSEDIQKGTGNIIVKKISDNSIVQTIDVTTPAVTVTGNQASFALSLALNTAYYIEVAAGAFKDLAPTPNNFAGITGNALWNFSTANLQNTLYEANFNTCATGTPGTVTNGFTRYSVTGAQVWDCTTAGHIGNGVSINGFANGTNVPNVDWLISPALDLTAATYPLLTFWSRTAFNGAPLQLKISTNYSGTGDPRSATWTDFNGRFPGLASNAWTESNNINLTAYKQAGVYVAFVYESTDEEGAQWFIDDFHIDNSVAPPPASISVNTNDIQFLYVPAGSTASKTFVLNSNDITTDVTITGSPEFLVSKDGITFSSSITYTQAEANNTNKTVYVQYAPAQNDKNSTGTVTVTTSSLTSTINVKGTSIDPIKTLEVVNWNIEWFGSTTLGPANEPQQEQNVKTILQNIGADVYGLLEVVDEAQLARVVAQMPGYTYVISNYGSHTNTTEANPTPLNQAQKLAFVYKTSVLSNVSTMPLLSIGINTIADTATANYNNWSSGRYPFMMNADVTLNGTTKNVKFVLVHAKANTSPTTASYNRRKAGAFSLDSLLNVDYASDNIIVLGDFNDDLDKSITAGFTTTSWDAFTTDANFTALTLPLSVAGKKSTVGFNDVIDHVIVSTEMNAYFMKASASILTDVSSLVTSYGTTTTDHYPVFTRFAFDASILPVKLIDFTATKQGNAVSINWKTAEEINTKEFVLERSADGQAFKAMGTVAAAGNASSARIYQYTDLQPLTGNNFYRMRMVDNDGKYTLSKVAKVNFERTYNITLWPNPAKGSFTVTSTTNLPINLQIADMNGRIVKTQQIINSNEKVIISNLTKGIYTVKMTASGLLQTQKLVIE